MDNRAKVILGGFTVLAVFIFALSSVSYVKTYSRSVEPSAFRSFSVSGEGKTVAVPDVAEFTFSVINQGGKDIAKLQGENTQKVNRAIEFVKSNGVDPKDIQTKGYNMEPRYQYFSCVPERELDGSRPCPPPEIVGYTITQTVLVKVRNFSKIGDLLSGVISSGANSVSQLFFTVDQKDTLESKARKEAIEKAQEKAKAVAEAGGFRLGRLLSIEEGAGPIYPFYAKGGLGSDARTLAAESAPTIEPGSQEITVNVVLRYEIE